MNLILTKLHRIHGRIVVNAWVKYRKPIFIGVRDIQPEGQNILSISAKKNGEKLTILNLVLTKLHRIHGRIVINVCLKYRKKIFIGIGDIHPDGQISDGRKD